MLPGSVDVANCLRLPGGRLQGCVYVEDIERPYMES